jgi:hypothetical protein
MSSTNDNTPVWGVDARRIEAAMAKARLERSKAAWALAGAVRGGLAAAIRAVRGAVSASPGSPVPY